MAKEPRPRSDKEEAEDDQFDPVARETVEKLDSYHEFLKEQRGDRITSDEW